MIIKCAWCRKDMGEKPPYEDKSITHTICEECKEKNFPEKKEGNPMTIEPEKPRCDIDDLLCQMQVLSHLKGMKSILGEEKFKGNFPELEGLDEKLVDRIGSQETTLREALENCGLSEVAPVGNIEIDEVE